MVMYQPGGLYWGVRHCKGIENSRPRGARPRGVQSTPKEARVARVSSARPSAKRRSSPAQMAFVGMQISKKWAGSGWYAGRVVEVEGEKCEVLWDDGATTTMATRVALRLRAAPPRCASATTLMTLAPAAPAAPQQRAAPPDRDDASSTTRGSTGPRLGSRYG